MNTQEPTGWPVDAVRHRLIEDWYIYQRTGGHRTSTDDLLTAWFAASRTGGVPRHYVDLGCGVGSVLLMILHRLRPESATGVEAQAQSFEMAQRSVAELPEAGERVRLVHSDFREAPLESKSFDLITASPPYFPPGTGVPPQDHQRLACRFEMRGGVEDYIATATRLMTEDGACYLVFQTAGDGRVTGAAAEAQLFVTARADVCMRTDREAPFLTVYELKRVRADTQRFRFAVRDPHGDLTPEYQRIRQELGLGVGVG